ncbi:MAG: mechanosensitive ion channel domain-containing protein [Kangiellaceae bacterium]|nr:mechanosensitive ion channel domain-containing protein [Kangiellaceae bacterium]
MSEIDFSKYLEQADILLYPWLVKIFFALLIFFVGKLIAKYIVKLVATLLTKAGQDETLIAFIGGMLNATLLVVVGIAALAQLGVNTTSLIALLGAAGLAVGLALKDSLQNFASGIMLIIFRPFSAGDYVEVAGVAGVVEKVNIFSTLLRTTDNREITIPNGSIYGDVITNFSARDTRRLDLIYSISYDDDVVLAKDVLTKVINDESRILPEPAPVIALSEFADSSINFIVRPWVNSSEYWDVKWSLNEKVKQAFDQNNLSIPYPQMDLHIANSDSNKA